MLLFAHLAIQMIFYIRKIVNGCGDIMKTISTTIKKKYMDKILSGEKISELKNANKFWKKRIMPIYKSGEESIINFLCGKKSYHFEIICILYHDRIECEIDGKLCYEWFEILIGNRIYKSKIYTNLEESEVRKYFYKWNNHEYVYCHDLLNFIYADIRAGNDDVILIADAGSMDKLHLRHLTKE